MLWQIFGAIDDCAKIIELDPGNYSACSIRSAAKLNLKDYYGPIADYTKMIELRPNDESPYVRRGGSKYDLGDLNGACKDWKKAASLGGRGLIEWQRELCN